MKRVRSNTKSRFLLYRGPEFTAVWSEFIVFNLIFGLVPLLTLVLCFTSCGLTTVKELLSQTSDLQVLSNPLSQEATDASQLRLSGRLVAGGSGSPPLCLVMQEERSGKNTRTLWAKTIANNAKLHTDEGIFVLNTTFARWEPEALKVTERNWRHLPDARSGGWFKEQCVEQGEQIFVEGCLQQDKRIGACKDFPLLITKGDGTAQPRIDALAASALVWLSLFGAAIILALLYGWRVAGAHPVVQALARWAGLEDKLSKRQRLVLGALCLWWVVALVVAWIFFAQLQWGGYLACAMVASLGAVVILFMRHRSQLLRAALKPIEHAPTAQLAHLKNTGQIAELAVRVKADAPLQLSPLSQQKAAWWRLSVDHIYKDGKNHSCSRILESTSESLLQVEDASGDGLLDLQHAELDLRALQHTGSSHSLRDTGVDALLKNEAYKTLQAEESLLVPGERLYVLGLVSTLKPSDNSMSYRDAVSKPVIGGSATQRLIIHAGSEGSLLRNLKLELRYLDLVMSALFAVELALLASAAWLASF